MPDETAAACAVPTALAIAGLELLDLRPHRELTRAHDLRERGELGVPDVRPREPDRIGHLVRSLAVPRDRPLEPLVEVDLRLEAEQLARLVDVGNAELDVRVVERLEDDLTGAARQALDALSEIVDRHRRARVADVEALADGVRMLEGEEGAVDHVVDVAPRADLRAVPVDREVASREGGLDERADRAAADLTRPEHVERPHRGRRQAELGVVRVRHVLAGELRDGVGPARLADRADRRDVRLVHVEGVLAEHLARREVDEPFERVLASAARPRGRCRSRSR